MGRCQLTEIEQSPSTYKFAQNFIFYKKKRDPSDLVSVGIRSLASQTSLEALKGIIRILNRYIPEIISNFPRQI